MKHLHKSETVTKNEIVIFWPVRHFLIKYDIGFYRDFSKYQLNAQFFYSSTIYMLHYAPQHVSSSTLLIIRRTNCITTASGIVTLCKQPYSMRVRLLTEGDDTIGPPDDEQRAARNMLRSVM